MEPMNYGEEIETVKQKLAEAERQTESSAYLREKLAALQRAQEAEREARRREAETRAAARAVRDAEADARRAEAAPLLAEFDAAGQPLAEIEHELSAYLQRAVGDAREMYRRYVDAQTKRNSLAGQLRALGDLVRHAEPLGFENFVRRAIRRFDNAGRTASGAGWAGEGH